MMNPTFDLVIVGVGGQGILLASKIIGHLVMAEGFGVKMSEVHGMSQRGGSVITHVRVGNHVHAPLVSEGKADFLVSFEALEAARAAVFLKTEGIAIVNDQRIAPMPVITGATRYPEDPLKVLQGYRVESVDAFALAIQAGSGRAVNLVLLGMLSRHLPFSQSAWERAVKESVPNNTLSTNLNAFLRGRDVVPQ